LSASATLAQEDYDSTNNLGGWIEGPSIATDKNGGLHVVYNANSVAPTPLTLSNTPVSHTKNGAML
jgi:hypothetical protein